MAKKVIIAVLEEVLGEYVLNIDKENLKIAALQGQIKLQNVHLDGDLIGQSILGAVGLSGFGILSCFAQSVRISIPFTNLEKEPTKFEMRGVHLVCLPLLPSTAHKTYGAGTVVDPRCTLRTRAKRSKLARYEGNFLSGRLPGEGPPAKRILRAVKEVERDLQRKRHRRRGSFSKNDDEEDDDNTLTLDSLVSDDMDTVLNGDSSMHGGSIDTATTFSMTSSEEKSSKDPLNSADLPELPRDWKVKLREKMMRNMEASLFDIHVRCEVSEGGLDFCHPDHRPKQHQQQREQNQYSKGDSINRSDSNSRPAESLKPDQRAFAFGLTLDNFVMRTANEKWEVGSHEKSSETSVKDHLGPNPYDARNNKLISFENLSMYWDDGPPFLISETPVMKLSSEEHRLSVDKVQARITAAMEALSQQQEPGTKIRESMQASVGRSKGSERVIEERGHQYIFQGFDNQIRQKLSNRMEPGPISCLAEFLPFQWDVKFRPHQFIQYQKLKSAMLSQKRFDTMLRQRPSENPLQNPRGWWKYAIGCVTSRPTSRPWHDVLRISKSRNRYVQLVVKKLLKASEGSGFHSGLSKAESAELVLLEDLLPIEALLAFHLIALRRFAKSGGADSSFSDKKSKDDLKESRRDKSPSRTGRVIGRSKLTRIFRGNKSKSSNQEIASNSAPTSSSLSKPPVPSMVATAGNSVPTVSLLEAMTIRLGRKPWYTDFKLDHASLNVTLLSSTDDPIVSLRSEMTGSARSYGGQGKVDYYFDVTKFEIVAESQTARGPGGDGKVLVVQATDEESHYLMDDQATIGDILDSASCEFDTQAVSDYMDLPPPGVVCRIAASKDPTSTKLSFSAHPATLVWTRPCFDAVAEFFGAPSTEMQTELTLHLKNAATPLARKAQLALVSPTALILHVNVAAPKIWVPFTSRGTDGALFLDAGNLRMACTKEDGETNTNWNVDATDIQVNFARWNLSMFKDRIMTPIPLSASVELPNSGVTSIIKPFQVRVVAGVREWRRTDGDTDLLNSYHGSVNCIDVTISPIGLNLVDAEVLARAIGKWYAQGLLRVRGRDGATMTAHNSDVASTKEADLVSSSAEMINETLTKSSGYETPTAVTSPSIMQSSMPHSLSLSVKKIEMALEGHSKVAFSDEKSVESHDYSLLEHAPSIRTYVVEAFDIGVKRVKHGQITSTKFVVGDASIVQLKDASYYNPMKDRHEASEAQYAVLERGSRNASPAEYLWTPRARYSSDHSSVAKGALHDNAVELRHNPEGEPPRTGVFTANLFHDGTNHLDEVEIDVDSIILRVTPTSLKDCVKAIRKIIELVQLMTREMERKVHEEGRKARRRGRETIENEELPTEKSRPVSPAFSMTSDLTDVHKLEESARSPSDSSLLIKVTVRDSTVLAGRPTAANSNFSSSGRRFPRRRKPVSFAVVQIVSNALVMFQSVENPDASGSKTLHVSLDNLSASVDTHFERVPTSQVGPMIGPTGAEFRVVYATENSGCVVSHDVSLDCEHLKSCLTPNDMSILVSIVRTMMERLRGVQEHDENGENQKRKRARDMVSSLVRYQKRGTGIATSIRVEVQTFSFVLLRAFRSKYGAPEFLSFNVREFKSRLGGCLSALSGEGAASISVDFYNSEVSDWEYAIEPFSVVLGVDQMPNELILDLSTPCPIQLNLTGIFLRDFSELEFDVAKGRAVNNSAENVGQQNVLTPSALSTVGLRRATESHSVLIHNHSGLDVNINWSGSSIPGNPECSVRFDSVGPGLVRSGQSVSLDSIFDSMEFQKNFSSNIEPTAKLCLSLTGSSAEVVGDRELVSELPISSSSGHSTSLHILRPVMLFDGSHHVVSPWQNHNSRTNGRTSPETVMTEGSRADYSYYNAEPVVEWCMQNQRLRSSTVDMFSLGKGRDLLSSSVWSPEEEYNVDLIDFTQFQGQEAPVDLSNEEEGTGEVPRQVASPSRKSQGFAPHRSNWLRPYLKNDSPEWTDMTCILRMARERVMLPDSNWIWVNDWTVDLSGNFGESTDADGWEYQADFETFTRTRRFYERGDSCRRRRWTRTRIVKPPRLDDPNRILKFVWETSRDDQGNFKIEIKSHVTLHNSTDSVLSFFVFSPSWDADKLIGSVSPGGKVHVPVSLASAVYLRLAKSRSKQPSQSIDDYVASDRVMILPTSYNSTVLLRSSMRLDDVSETNLHFSVNVQCVKGMVDIFVEPVLKVINLLPCQLECQLGEVLRPSDKRAVDSRPSLAGVATKRIANVETLTVASGKEGRCIAINPASKPHISLRVPGYKWSAWQRIVNRKADSYTWRPPEAEEDWHINSNKADADYAEEFKSLVRFDRASSSGDPLFLIISIECGHTPKLRVYSQYWIIDKTGFGCRFCEGFTDLMGTAPDVEFSRRSHLPQDDSRDQAIQKDIEIQGHQWSIGMSGMTLYFSLREKIALSIESGAGDGRYKKTAIQSKWVAPMDISNVMPKTVFSVDELGGTKRFELAMSVTVCPGVFARTRLITLIPRYQIVNLLKRELVVSQDGCLSAETLIPSQSSVPFHWERQSLPSKVRLGAPTREEKDSGDYDQCWTNGCIQLDKVGITSMRLPTSQILPTKPMVVQAEVRLASKEQASAVVIVIWSANEESNPLYLLRNRTSHTILCRQPLQDEPGELGESADTYIADEGCSGPSGTSSKKSATQKNNGFECGAEIAPIVRSFLGLDRIEEFVWVLRSGDVACFGFDDPEKPHILEWACVDTDTQHFNEDCKKAFLEVDAMGTVSNLGVFGTKEIRCQIGAEHSTKVIEFVERLGPRSRSSQGGASSKRRNVQFNPILDAQTRLGSEQTDIFDDDEDLAFSLRINIPTLSIGVVDNADPTSHGREILLAQFDQLFASFSQSREGYHEFEFRLMSLQVDNHVPSSIHPVLIFCPKLDEREPFLHMSAVRRLQQHSTTYVFRYVAFRVLEVNIFLDRGTAESVARFIEPLRISKETESDDAPDWVTNLTIGMERKFAKPDRRAPRDIEKMILTANSGRIYFEQLHLHPIRLAFTFTQEWMELNQGTESLMVLQFIRGMASVAEAPLTFTSFVVGHVFESPQALFRVIATHYSSQLTKQIFGILGSLAILGAPADFISNVGTGVRDFFYEPIQGAVHGPRQFIEGLEAGTQSLARGVFVGVVRGAANVTEVVNANLAGLTADDDFIDERKAHQRMLMDAMSRGVTSRTFSDSLYLAGASVARGLRSGAVGIVEQPTRYASKHGPVGFVKGVGKAIVGAVVKPVVGVGDAAALLMNHVSDATSNKQVFPKIPKRLRRALPSRSTEKPNCVVLLPYDDRAAKAQKIVTGGESVNDVYIGHVNIPSHLIIASDQCLWAIDRRSREPWCVSWEEISHFAPVDAGMRIFVFSQTGLKPYVFQAEDQQERTEFDKLLSMQQAKMGNATSNLAEFRSFTNGGLDFSLPVPGIKSRQANHVFGSTNKTRKRLANTIKDEIDLIEQCFARVKKMGSESPNFFETLDDEAWTLVSCWGQVFSGLSSRRCIAASVINGTGNDIQIKSTKLVEGGSPCYSIPTREFDPEQGVLHAGGVIIFFGWGVVPSLLQAGNVFMHVETNAFIADLADKKCRDTYSEAMTGYQVGFLEKSYDDAGWWAKYWLLITKS